MAANPREELRDLLDLLSDGEVRELLAVLHRDPARPAHAHPRPLTTEDILLPAPVLPDEETADAMIAAVRRWRCEAGDV